MNMINILSTSQERKINMGNQSMNHIHLGTDEDFKLRLEADSKLSIGATNVNHTLELNSLEEYRRKGATID